MNEIQMVNEFQTQSLMNERSSVRYVSYQNDDDE